MNDDDKLIFHLYSLLLLSLLFKSMQTLRIKSCAANLFSQRSRKLFQRKSRVFMYSGINGNIYGMVCGDVFSDINENIYGRIIGNVNGNKLVGLLMVL